MAEQRMLANAQEGHERLQSEATGQSSSSHCSGSLEATNPGRLLELMHALGRLSQLHDRAVTASVLDRQRRRAADHKRLTVWSSDSNFMAELQKQIALGKLNGFEELLRLGSVCQEIRNDLGPIEADLADANQTWESRAFELMRAEQAIYRDFESEFKTANAYAADMTSDSDTEPSVSESQSYGFRQEGDCTAGMEIPDPALNFASRSPNPPLRPLYGGIASLKNSNSTQSLPSACEHIPLGPQSTNLYKTLHQRLLDEDIPDSSPLRVVDITASESSSNSKPLRGRITTTHRELPAIRMLNDIQLDDQGSTEAVLLGLAQGRHRSNSPSRKYRRDMQSSTREHDCETNIALEPPNLTSKIDHTAWTGRIEKTKEPCKLKHGSQDSLSQLLTDFETHEQRINKWILHSTLLSRIDSTLLKNLVDAETSVAPSNWSQLVMAFWERDITTCPRKHCENDANSNIDSS